MRAIALAAAAALGAAAALAAGAPAPVTHLAAADVRVAFAKGMPLLESEAYKVHASRREAAGQAEVHVRDTDVIYVLEGSATLVTGGRVVGPREVAREEIRGDSIEGGAIREIAAGDVVVVPNGTPHWFQSVRGPVLYYVVKVTDREAAR
jgi:glc operon protein GlcG